MSTLSRRAFISGAAFNAGAVALTNCGTAAFAHEDITTAPPAYDCTVPESWDREADVVVVGQGIAGVCALIEAYQQGLDVIAVNAASSAVDSSCTRSGGWFCGTGSRIQKMTESMIALSCSSTISAAMAEMLTILISSAHGLKIREKPSIGSKI